MPEVIINRCTLRVVRRHGWSWGPRPERLLKAAVAALPLLLASKLGDLFRDESDHEIMERINLTVPVTLSELLDLGAEFASSSGPSEFHSSGAFEERLTSALKLAFINKPLILETTTQDTEISTNSLNSETHQLDVESVNGDYVLRVLIGWKRAGELEIHLASFTEQELQAWYRAASASVAKLAAPAKGVWAERISQLNEGLRRAIQACVPNRAAALRASLRVLVEIGESPSISSIDESSLEKIFNKLVEEFDLTVNQQVGSSITNTETELSVDSPGPGLRASHETQSAIEPAPQLNIQRVTRTEFNVRSVLPFLLLGPLAKIGYLEAVGATLETVGLTSQAPAFATALAYKVLTPPERGWRRDDEDLTVAAAFAGVETARSGDELAELARKISGHLTPVDSLISYTLVKGHQPNCSMLLERTREEDGPEGFLLVEMEGLFPVAWADNITSLMPVLRYFRETNLLIEKRSVGMETLRELDTAGFRFITDAPPKRGENWREVRRSPRERWYSNELDAKPSVLGRAAADITRAAEEVQMLWRALKVDRPAIPTARHTELERSVSLAAALALGTISWVLWSKRETVTPLLALERFGNLAGRVRFTSNAIQIQLPLGLRQRDLYEHGLLTDIRNIPWLAGRKIEFLGG